MRMITDEPHMIFASVKDAQKAISVMGFDDGELRIIIDPKGSGRCVIEVLDLEDGKVIGRI
jgi:ABC-type uncharacterized transport system ATPase subunit